MIGAGALSDRLGLAPNIDLALAVMRLVHGLPTDAPFVIFALARLTGWVAHVMEQAETGAMIRPRAQFVDGAPVEKRTDLSV